MNGKAADLKASNFLMSSFLFVGAAKTHMGEIIWYETPVCGAKALGLLALEHHREMCCRIIRQAQQGDQSFTLCI